MIISNKIQDSLNEQINKEIYSAYLYFSMAAYFESLKFSGMASWMNKQASEELKHAKRIYNYIIERGGRVILKAIESPTVDWKSAEDAFQGAVKHEEFITASIYKLVELASAEKDLATVAMLQWFVTEQVEEESSVGQIYDKLKLIGNSTNGLFMLDHQLAKRE